MCHKLFAAGTEYRLCLVVCRRTERTATPSGSTRRIDSCTRWTLNKAETTDYNAFSEDILFLKISLRLRSVCLIIHYTIYILWIRMPWALRCPIIILYPVFGCCRKMPITMASNSSLSMVVRRSDSLKYFFFKLSVWSWFNKRRLLQWLVCAHYMPETIISVGWHQ